MRNLQKKAEELALYAQLYREWGAQEVEGLTTKMEKEMDDTLEKLKTAAVDPILQEKEPDDYQKN